MPTPNTQTTDIRHYHWAGLDFMFDADGRPVLLEANRCSHMLWEYLLLYQDDGPFRRTAELLNGAPGPTCLLWRRDDPLPDADEDACWIARHLQPHLDREPLICHVEENRAESETLLTREGERVKPGSLFRWWYDLPWTHERAGTLVINPNALWVAVRDKLACYETLKDATTFGVPQSFAVESPQDAQRQLDTTPSLFETGYVVKPRVGFGGHGVQVLEWGETPKPFSGGQLLSQRIRPKLREGKTWDVRVFVMGGQYFGGVLRASEQAVTNVFQGGAPLRLDDRTAAALEQPALEAVRLLDAAAERIHQTADIPRTDLTRVEY